MHPLDKYPAIHILKGPKVSRRENKMAIKTVLVDDLDETEGAETRPFSIGGTDYEIHLTDKHYGEMERAMQKYVAAARKRGHRRQATKTKITRPSSGTDMKAIREWAGKQGLPVSDRGKIPQDIVDKFNAEHNGSPQPAFSG